MLSKLADNNVSKGAGTGYQWKDASSSNVDVGTKYVSLTFKVTPKASSAKLSGIIGLVNCGKGSSNMVGKTYINGSAVGTPFAVTKNNTSQYTVSFDTPVSITSETEITLTFENVKANKGISLQLQDVGLMFAE